MKHGSSNFLTSSEMPGKPISQGTSEKNLKSSSQKKRLQQTAWEDLQITNDFLFGKVMQDPELCKGLLQRILPELEIDHIEYPELQKSLQPDHDTKSIRLDVYMQDDKDTVYNIEMQVKTTNDIPKRSRYYQSIIDLQWLDRGETDYKNLNKTYIIFICLSDLYQKGRHIYTFENICKEDRSIIMGDEAVKIILNAKGTLDDVSGELKAFLDYAAGKKAEDIFVEKIDQALKKAKKNRKWRREYMTLKMKYRETWEEGHEVGREKGITEGRETGLAEGREAGLAEGITAGREAGEEIMAQLLQKMSEDHRLSELERVIQDKEYRKQLYKEYHISDR